jgi:hypothetical protein
MNIYHLLNTAELGHLVVSLKNLYDKLETTITSNNNILKMKEFGYFCEIL